MLSTYERRRRYPSLRTLSKILDALYANVSDLGAAMDEIERQVERP